MFLNSNEQFLIRKKYLNSLQFSQWFMKKTVFWRVATYTIIYRCHRLSRCVLLYLDHIRSRNKLLKMS